MLLSSKLTCQTNQQQILLLLPAITLDKLYSHSLGLTQIHNILHAFTHCNNIPTSIVNECSRHHKCLLQNTQILRSTCPLVSSKNCEYVNPTRSNVLHRHYVPNSNELATSDSENAAFGRSATFGILMSTQVLKIIEALGAADNRTHR